MSSVICYLLFVIGCWLPSVHPESKECHSESRPGRDEESAANYITMRFFVVPLVARVLRMTS
jgi:hypothetical protein